MCNFILDRFFFTIELSSLRRFPGIFGRVFNAGAKFETDAKKVRGNSASFEILVRHDWHTRRFVPAISRQCTETNALTRSERDSLLRNADDCHSAPCQKSKL